LLKGKLYIYLKCVVFIAIFQTYQHTLIGQNNRYLLQKGEKIEIPFEYVNGLIELTVKINGVNLKFIFDTGAEHTILSNNTIASLLKIKPSKEIEVYGADFTKKIKAFVTYPVNIKIFNSLVKDKTGSIEITTGKSADEFIRKKKTSFVVRNMPILLLDTDIFNFDVSENGIQGILGASFFSNAILKIDYKKKVLVVYPYDYNLSLKSYREIPVQFAGHKPIIKTKIKINDTDSLVDINILLDTGSSIPLLFLNNIDSKISLPSKTIIGKLGIGLGGNLNGYIGLIDKIEFGEFKFHGQISKFQYMDSIRTKTINKTRDGILGNDILKKFTIVIDNYRKKLYFKPNKDYYKPIKYDKSGINLFATGKNHNKFYIKSIIPDSPADKAGLKPKDIIYSSQYLNHIFWSHERLVNLFKKKENKKIRLKIIRDNKKMIFKFRLKDMLK